MGLTKRKLAQASAGALAAVALLTCAALRARAQSSEDLRSQAAADLAPEFKAALDQARAQSRQFQAQGVREQEIKDWWHKHTEGAPYTGRHRIIIIPAKDANALGTAIYSGMIAGYRKKGLIDDDPQAVAQIKRVCDKLIAAADQPQLQWEYHLIDTGTVNAFAIAGGKIGVLKGILPYTQDDAGLAVVLGHEVSHVVERHLDERLSELILLQVGSLAADIAFPYFAPALITTFLHGANVVATIQQIYQLAAYEGVRLGMDGFSRAQESEADHVGLIMMAKAGYDPMLAPAFWKRISAGLPDPKHPWLTRWWRDHPLTSERIANEEKWAPDIRKQYYHPDTPQPGAAAADAPAAEQPAVVGVSL